MPNLILPVARASTAATSRGPTVRAASVLRAMGQVDFGAVFTKLSQYDYDGWAVVEWEDFMKHPEQGATEGAEFVSAHLIQVTERAFDDFAGGSVDDETNKKILGL